MKNVSNKLLKSVMKDAKIRRSVVKEDHVWFFSVYFSHYIKYESAKFHENLFDITEDEVTKIQCVTAFRNCAKTTIITLSYPIWAIIGKQQKKFIVIVSQTQRQAKMHLLNIKRELENNQLLRKDLGPFEEESNEWGAYALVLPKYNAKIMAVSKEQTIRGFRFNEHRPDLIIADDLESLDTVKTKDSRDDTFAWITGEIIPAGDKGTKIMFLGNLLHEDCLLMRLKEKITLKQIDGRYLEIPLLDDENNIAWPGKYPTMDDIKTEERNQFNEIAWQREYLLKIVPEEGRVILPEHIKYYDKLPPQDKAHNFRDIYTGVDLAMSLSSTADYTAMVSVAVYGYENDLQIYVLPHPVNSRMLGDEIVKTAKNISTNLGKGKPTKLFIEDVGGQRYIVDALTKDKFPATGVRVGNAKKDRLAGISYSIQQATVLFPAQGVDTLKTQLLNFGVEKYDDLVDALTLVLAEVLRINHNKNDMGIITQDSQGNYALYKHGEDCVEVKRYFYLGKWHTEPPEDYYRRIQGYLDRGLL